MAVLLNWRVWVAVALAVGLAISHGTAYKTGRALVRADWDKDIAQRAALALAASEAARVKEQALQTQNQKVSADYAKQKKANSVLAANLDDSLRQLESAIGGAASPNAPTSPRSNGTGGLERELLGSCARSFAELGKEADRLEGKVVGLQSYISEVCKN